MTSTEKTGAAENLGESQCGKENISNEDERSYHRLITRELVEAAIAKDFGEEACLKSFEIRDFTKPGDNYVSVVTSVFCKVGVGEETVERSYVLKLNPQFDSASGKGLFARFFKSESGFLTAVSPVLTSILESVGQPSLRVPECVHVSDEKDKEVMITKDLRSRKFRMIDRTKGLDIDHITLVLEELARIHSAGYIHKKRIEEGGFTLQEMYPYKTDFFLGADDTVDNFYKFVNIDNSVQILELSPGFGRAAEWLKQKKDKALDAWKDLYYSPPEKFTTICHGDCWTNNLLFRYGEDGRPAEVSLLDLQMWRECSVVYDLLYFLVTSVEPEFRRSNFDLLLQTYYNMFDKVIRRYGTHSTPFSLEQLRQEYIDRFLIGLILGMLVLPIILRREEEGLCDIDKGFNQDKEEEFLTETKEATNKLLKNDIFMSRFLGLFLDLDYFNIL